MIYYAVVKFQKRPELKPLVVEHNLSKEDAEAGAEKLRSQGSKVTFAMPQRTHHEGGADGCTQCTDDFLHLLTTVTSATGKKKK